MPESAFDSFAFDSFALIHVEQVEVTTNTQSARRFPRGHSRQALVWHKFPPKLLP